MPRLIVRTLPVGPLCFSVHTRTEDKTNGELVDLGRNDSIYSKCDIAERFSNRIIFGLLFYYPRVINCVENNFGGLFYSHSLAMERLANHGPTPIYGAVCHQRMFTSPLPAAPRGRHAGFHPLFVLYICQAAVTPVKLLA